MPVGDGRTDDTLALAAAIRSGAVFSSAGYVFLVSDTITLPGGLYDFHGATIRAGKGMEGKPLVAASNLSSLRVSNLRIDCAGIAAQGFYGLRLNTPGVCLDNVWVGGATGAGFFLDACQASRLYGITSRASGGHGIHALSCNALIVRDSLSEWNVGDGVCIEPGKVGYSSGMSVLDCTIQVNGGHGVSVGVGVLSPVKVRGCWIEANEGSGIHSAGKAHASNNYILTNHTGANWAVTLTNTARGVYTHNNLGGADNGGRVWCDNSGIAKMAESGLVVAPNYTAHTGAQSAFTLAIGGTTFPAP